MSSGGVWSHPSGMPGIQQLLQSYVDRTGDSTREMSRKTDYAVSYQRFTQLLTERSKQIPREPKTIAGLSRLLMVPESTIVKAYLVDMGLPVEDSWSRLAQLLPPGVEELDGQDIDAIVYLVRRLVDARRAANAAGVAPVTELRPPGWSRAARNGSTGRGEQGGGKDESHED